MIQLLNDDHGFRLVMDDVVLMEHSEKSPILFVGTGEERFHEYRGNFKVEEYTFERTALRYTACMNNQVLFFFNKKDPSPSVIMSVEEENVAIAPNPSDERPGFSVNFVCLDSDINRFWLRLSADKEERIYGLGEQMSYFNLRGKDFPILTSEPGVGRDKNDITTFFADTKDMAGGDYYNTNYPEPTFISSKKYWCHVNSTVYGVADFRHETFHELSFFEVPDKLTFKASGSLVDTVKSLADFAGKLPPLPDWVHDGVILGIQGGTEAVDGYVDQALEAGINVSGLFVQDWQGIKNTSFGQRLYWDWKWNEERYPNLNERIREYEAKGIKFLGYINPNVVKDGSLYEEAKGKGLLALNKDGDVYDVDYGEFDCGIVDFTNPEAFEWFKGVIKTHLIDFGLKGWMADFGEYLPMDCVLYNGVSAKEMHNAWPAIWAKCNYEAIEEAGMLGEILYFMRAGGFGSQKYCVSLWAGDQSVNWSRHDGMPTVISGALSSGMVGNPYHHSDIGGYTSLHGNIRTKELFLRWLEMGTFTSLMRTHEGNRPLQNFQYYHDEETIQFMKKFSEIRKAMKPYFKALDIEASREGSGLPMQRPLVMHYETDPITFELQTEYLLGEDVLVAPVMSQNATELNVYLPDDHWIHFWTSREYTKGLYKIPADMGHIPVFYRKDSKFAKLFREVSALNAM